MRMVLDHVSQGLLIADLQGRLSTERSAIVDEWFPEGVPDSLVGFFAGADPGAAGMFAAGWEQLVEGFLPIEVSLEQLPREIHQGGRIFALGLEPIFDEAGGLARMLVVLSDVTEARRRLVLEREQKELMAIFEHLSVDRGGVVEFASE